LVTTISAFTVAHSVTLAGSVLGVLALRSPPVEACIALSIVLVAREALSARATLTKRAPELVAFGFGLVHGLGFAGALRDVGLPDKHIALPLFTFNLGVELGQLGLVAGAFVLTRALVRLRLDVPLRAPALYGLGGIACYWTLARLVALGS
jgi:hydrogenase/urease accessory protein HupE